MNNIINFRAYSFEPYGLNKFRNILEPPDCDCGCGGKADTVCFEEDDVEGVFSFACDMLDQVEDLNAAIFMHAKNGEMFAMLHDGELLSLDETDYDFFAFVDGINRFDMYGLLVERESNCWKIITK